MRSASRTFLLATILLLPAPALSAEPPAPEPRLPRDNLLV
jgi:hypothetical protein